LRVRLGTVQKGLGDLDRYLGRQPLETQSQDVRVVPQPRAAGDPWFPRQRRPTSGHLVRRDGRPGPGPAHDHARIRLATRDRPTDSGTEVWPGRCRDDVDLTPRGEIGQPGPGRLVVVTGAECDPHAFTVAKGVTATSHGMATTTFPDA